MPKSTAERIIDTGRASAFVPGAVAAGGVAVGNHVLATTSGLGDQHTVTGLTAGQVLRASSAATAAFAQLAHADLGGVTADQHHAQSHVLASTSGLGADHTVSGLTAGYVLRASGATAAAFAQLQHSDLGGVSANQHHNQQHSITGSDHTITANALQVVGATATNTLGLLTPSSNPGAAAAILATDSSGYLRLVQLGIGMAPAYPLDVTGDVRLSGTLYADGGIVDFGTDYFQEGTTYLDLIGSKPLRLNQTIQASGWSVTAAGGASFGGNLTVGSTVFVVDVAGSRVGINRTPDAQFDLDVAGAIRGTWVVGKHAIQLSSATAVVHFDGPAPYNLDNTGSNFTHTGVAGTETGGVIYRPGRFSKSVQMAPATTNLCTNPSFETDTSTPAGWTGQNLSTVTTSIATDVACYGGKSLRLVNSTASQDAYYYHNIAGLSASTAYTISVWVNCASFTAGALSNRCLFAYDTANSGATVQVATLTTRTAGWVRLQVTVTMTASPGNLQIRLYAPQATVQYDGVQVEKRAYATPYCDGSLGQGHTWSGTAHASTSSRTATRLEYPIRMVSAQAGTIMMWVRADGYNSNGGLLWSAGSANGVLVSYISANGSLIFTVNSVQVATSANFGVATWRHVAWSWSAAANECKLFVDGVQAGSTATYSAQTLHATLLGIGSNPTIADIYAHNGMIDEFVLLDYAADPKLIRSIYESDAPVFVESSVAHWRAPSAAPIWVDEYGLWVKSVTGNAVLGVYAGDPARVAASRAWGGIDLGDNDVLIGRSTGGYVHWDDSAQTLNVSGTITATAGSISGALTLGASGGIYQGTGTFASPTTGLKIWNDGGAGRIGGYNGGTLQWYAGTDGKLYAGGGNISLDANGINIAAGSVLRFLTSTTLRGVLEAGNPVESTLSNYPGMTLKSSAGATSESVNLLAKASGGRKAEVAADAAAGGARVRLYAYSGSALTSSLLDLGESYFDLQIQSGNSALYITASGHASLAGGLRVAGDPGAGVSGQVSLTNSTSGVSTGLGTVKMGGATYRDSTGWLKIWVAGNARYIPFWDAV